MLCQMFLMSFQKMGLCFPLGYFAIAILINAVKNLFKIGDMLLPWVPRSLFTQGDKFRMTQAANIVFVSVLRGLHNHLPDSRRLK